MLRFLSSMQLAIFLIASIAGMAVIATLVGNESVYTSGPFLTLVGAFALNLALCTIKMLPALRLTWQRRVQDIGDGANYTHYQSLDDGRALDAIERFLQTEHYRIEKLDTGEAIKVLAIKGKASLPAPHLLHIAILVVLVGAVMSSFSVTGGVFAYIGQSSPMTTAVRQQIGDGSASANALGERGDDYIKVLDFQTVYDEQGAVDNWVTHFDMVIDNQQVVTDGMTQVNYPYKYKNILIYQNSYGYHYLVEIKGSTEDDGTYTVPSGRHYPIAGTEREFMLMDMGKERTLLEVVRMEDSGEETVISAQVVEPGNIVEAAPGVTIEYLRPNPYTVLEVKVSYGIKIVFCGFILASFASLLFLAGRYREIRIVAPKDAAGIRLQVVCKNKVIAQGIEEKLQQYLVKEAI